MRKFALEIIHQTSVLILTVTKMRTFAEIGREVKTLWKKPYFGAVPYIDALCKINSSDKNAPYLFETAKDIVPYALSNMQTWRGEDARRIKAELKSMIK